MKPKENIIIKDEDKEVRDFLVKLCAARSLSVELSGEKFIVEIRREHVSDAGRQFLIKGGPATE
jgi:hypothetical protein